MSLIFYGKLNKAILLDHYKKTSKELFSELSSQKADKYTEVTIYIGTS